MNEELQKRIAEYSKYTEGGKASESETKRRVTSIHELKEKMKKETETLKKLKQQIKEVQERQRDEREVSCRINCMQTNLLQEENAQKDVISYLLRIIHTSSMTLALMARLHK